MAAPAVASHCSGQRRWGWEERRRWCCVRETRLSPRQASQRVAVPSRDCALQSHPFSPFSQFAGLLRQTLHSLLAAVSGQQERQPGGPPRPGPRLWVWRGWRREPAGQRAAQQRQVSSARRGGWPTVAAGQQRQLRPALNPQSLRCWTAAAAAVEGRCTASGQPLGARQRQRPEHAAHPSTAHAAGGASPPAPSG